MTIKNDLPGSDAMSEGAATPSEPLADTDTSVTLDDVIGQKIDRDQYQRSPDGSLILGANGLPKKKPGRKPKAESSGNFSTEKSAEQKAPKTALEKKAQKVSSEELARAFLHLTVGGMSVLVGEEWNFENQQEADGMKAAVATYIEAKGDGEMSPEGMLLLVVGAYAVPRMAHENTQSKLGKLWGKITALFKRN